MAISEMVISGSVIVIVIKGSLVIRNKPMVVLPNNHDDVFGDFIVQSRSRPNVRER